MACTNCEERGKLLKEARDALNRGDRAEAGRLLKEVFGSAIGDISKLQAIVFKQKIVEPPKPPQDGEAS
jgi:hypothetical protein